MRHGSPRQPRRYGPKRHSRRWARPDAPEPLSRVFRHQRPVVGEEHLFAVAGFQRSLGGILVCGQVVGAKRVARGIVWPGNALRFEQGGKMAHPIIHVFERKQASNVKPGVEGLANGDHRRCRVLELSAVISTSDSPRRI